MIFDRRFLLAAAVFIIIAVSAGYAYPQQSRVVKGKLHEVEAPYPKSPKYAVELEEPVMVGMSVLTEVELYSEDTDLGELVGRRVVATGTFVQWRTQERGGFIVMNVCEINPLR